MSRSFNIVSRLLHGRRAQYPTEALICKTAIPYLDGWEKKKSWSVAYYSVLIPERCGLGRSRRQVSVRVRTATRPASASSSASGAPRRRRRSSRSPRGAGPTAPQASPGGPRAPAAGQTTLERRKPPQRCPRYLKEAAGGWRALLSSVAARRASSLLVVAAAGCRRKPFGGSGSVGSSGATSRGVGGGACFFFSLFLRRFRPFLPRPLFAIACATCRSAAHRTPRRASGLELACCFRCFVLGLLIVELASASDRRAGRLRLLRARSAHLRPQLRRAPERSRRIHLFRVRRRRHY